MKPKNPNRPLAETQQLFEVSRNILDAFKDALTNRLPSKEIASREKALNIEINTLCAHIISMAAAEVVVRGLHEKHHDPEQEQVDINDVGCIAASLLFDRRKGSGLYDIVHILGSFFKRNPDAKPIELFNYLTAVVSRSLRHTSKQKASFDNPWYYRVARCVDFHIKSRPRYTIEGKLVIALEGNASNNPSLTATSEDMIALCNHASAIPKRAAAAVDLIFDCLAESERFGDRVERHELYLAVYKLMTPHMIPPYPQTAPSTPADTLLVSRMHVEAYDLLDEMEESYQWRKTKDGETRTAFIRAGEDILLDWICFGERRNSLKQYLSAYLDGLAEDGWHEYKGSFQNFVKVLEKKWAERLRAL